MCSKMAFKCRQGLRVRRIGWRALGRRASCLHSHLGVYRRLLGGATRGFSATTKLVEIGYSLVLPSTVKSVQHLRVSARIEFVAAQSTHPEQKKYKWCCSLYKKLWQRVPQTDRIIIVVRYILFTVFGRPFVNGNGNVCKTLCYRTVVLSVPYVCPGCLQRWCIVAKRLDGSSWNLTRR